MTKGLFLDRDGTLIADKGYVHRPEDIEILPGVPGALRRARELGFLLFLFTNQSGVNRGFFAMGDVLRVQARMTDLIGLPEPLFTDVCVAPERPDEPSLYRKPSPRFIREMTARHGLDPSRSYMVGDANSDVRAAAAAGVVPVGLPGPRLALDQLSADERRRLRLFPSLADFVAALDAEGRLPPPAPPQPY